MRELKNRHQKAQERNKDIHIRLVMTSKKKQNWHLCLITDPLAFRERNITVKQDGETRFLARDGFFSYPIIFPRVLGLSQAGYYRGREAGVTCTLHPEQRARRQSASSVSVRLVNQHNVAWTRLPFHWRWGPENLQLFTWLKTIMELCHACTLDHRGAAQS